MTGAGHILAAAVLLAGAAQAIEVLPSDRLAMADRLFNRGDYVSAAAEYRALSGEKSIAADELLYRLAECERALGRAEGANRLYAELANKFPLSKHAARARLMVALSKTGAERKAAFVALDTDRVEAPVRAAALYHYGAENGDVAALERSAKLDPNGTYAPYARLRRGLLLSESKDAAVRRTGVGVLLDIAFGGGALADEALYLAATVSYREGKYGEAGSLFRRYRKLFPNGSRAEATLKLSIWCDFMEGRYADAAAACGEAKTDDTAYVKAAATRMVAGDAAAAGLFRAYLDDYPQGRYRKEAELELSRIEFAVASKGADVAKTVEAAKRAAAKGEQPGDVLRLGWALERAGRTADAEKAYVTTVKMFPGTPEAVQALYARAMLAARSGEWAKAELSFAEAVANKGLDKEKLALAWYWRGVAALRLGHESEGCGFLKKALEGALALDQEREARLMLADADLRAGRRDAAKAAYAQLVREGAAERMSASRLHTVAGLLSGAEAETCARALAAAQSADWRQCGWVRLGELEAEKGAFTAAIAAYRKALAEDVRTEGAATAALALGRLETRAGDFKAAAATLNEAVKLNAKDAKVRAQAYVALAENARAAGDAKSARGYATVVATLFDDAEALKAAEAVINSLPEDKEPSK